MPDRYEAAGPEPSLEELLADPIMHLLLERDAIDPVDLLCYLRSIRDRLQAAPEAAAAA